MSTSTITETTQYLTFKFDNEHYALEISKVREVLDFIKVTKIPRTPDFMRGVINLRGNVVPVVDLKLKFGMAAIEKSVDTCIIISEIKVDDNDTVLGLMADSVDEVIEMEPKNIEHAPQIGMRLNTEFIKGVGKRSDEFIIILDIDKIFSADELSYANVLQEKESDKKDSFNAEI
ncbi:chemotaxis protein CheW [candidate division KSB1 bacterium]|nr:chemotaxis protein CheW [candidate division KSB1 bacterium]